MLTEEQYQEWLASLPEPQQKVIRAINAIGTAAEAVLEVEPIPYAEATWWTDWLVVVADIKKLNAYANSYCMPPDTSGEGGQ